MEERGIGKRHRWPTPGLGYLLLWISFFALVLASTIDEAAAPDFSTRAFNFGVVTFWLAIIGLVWANLFAFVNVLFPGRSWTTPIPGRSWTCRPSSTTAS